MKHIMLILYIGLTLAAISQQINPSQISGSGVVQTPSRTQTLLQPAGTSFSINTFNYMRNASLFAADIADGVATAIRDCMKAEQPRCTVTVPAGTYTTAKTIKIPQAVASFQNGFELRFDRGAKITYTGEGDALLIGGVANTLNVTNFSVVSPNIVVTSDFATGIHIQSVYGLSLYDPQVVGPGMAGKGAGIWYDGSGQAVTLNPQISNIGTGLYFTKNSNSTLGNTPDNNTILGGQVIDVSYGYHDTGISPVLANHLVGTLIANAQHPVVSENSRDLVLDSLYIEAGENTNPLIDLGTNSTEASSTVVRGNHLMFSSAGTPRTLDGPSLVRINLGNYLTVEDNNLLVGSAKHIIDVGTYSGHIITSNNSVSLTGEAITRDLQNNSLHFGITQSNLPGSLWTDADGINVNAYKAVANGDAVHLAPGKIVAPNLASGHNVESHIGVDSSKYNGAVSGFHFNAAVSTDNYAYVGLIGANSNLKIDGQGQIGWGNGVLIPSSTNVCQSNGSNCWSTVPSSSSSMCNIGQQAFDLQYHYICVARNTWKRATLSNW